MNEVATSKPEDILWNNIMIQYTAIIRAQKIMYVAYDDSLSKKYLSGLQAKVAVLKNMLFSMPGINKRTL